MKPLLTIAITVLLLQPPPSFAGHDDERADTHKHSTTAQTTSDKTAVLVQPNEAVIQVKGIVCSFCSLGIQKKLSKLPFVDQSKYNDGSIVDIETQRITIAVKPGETLDVKQVYKSVLDGGYNPVKAVVADKNHTITYDAEGEICTATC